jgi:hypothetical protein
MATRYLVPGGDGNYDSTSNWSATDGGASGASFPVAADDIIISVNSLNAPLNINVVSACKSFSASSYTGTVSVDNDFSVNGTTNTGNITLSSGMTITGSASFIKVPTSTTGVITSNGAIFDCNFIFQAAAATTTTITGAMRVEKNLTFSLNSTAINTISSGTISVGGDIINNSPVAGTSPLQMIGSTTANITQTASRFLQINLIINKTGILNINDLYWGGASRTLTYTSGVVNHSGILYTAISSVTFNTNGIIWNIIKPAIASTLNLTSTLKTSTIEFIANGGSFTLAGTHGFDCDNFIFSSINASGVTLRQNITYKINSYILVTSTQFNNVQVRTNTGIANLELGLNSVMQLYKVNFSRIKATKKILRVVGGVVTDCTNVYTLSSNLKQYNTTR